MTLDRARGRFRVAPFAISKYAVTYDQYKAFLEDPHGYRESRWWAGLKHEKRFGAQFREIGNCPAENVSWFDAVAFCRWLDMRLRKGSEMPSGCEVRLPTEPEWQQAFNSGSAYRYPWGPKWSDGRTNSEEARLERTVAVGVFPRGASKQGVEDLLGNVWEWCLTSKDSPGNGDVSLGGGRAFRGGAYRDDRLFSLLRIQNARVSRNAVNGFRVCRAPNIPE